MKQKRAILTLAATAAFVVSPFLSSPFAGFREDQLPFPQVNPPIQPEGYAFAIWGLIYSWLVLSAVYGIVRRPHDKEWNAAREPLMVCLAVGAIWLPVANASAIWATILIFVMAAMAIAAAVAAPRADRWLFQAPVAILAGWLTAASFVSLGSTAAGYGLITGSLGWAFIGIIGALLVSIMIQRTIPHAPEYGLTVIWALVGIIAANYIGTRSVALLAAAGIIIVLAVIVASRSRISPAEKAV